MLVPPPAALSWVVVSARWLPLFLLLVPACASTPTSNGGAPDGSVDAPARDFTCAGTWVCAAPESGVVTLTLTPDPRGCLLVGLTPDTVLASSGTLTQGARTVGSASGSGDSASFAIDGAGYKCRGATASTRLCEPRCGM